MLIYLFLHLWNLVINLSLYLYLDYGYEILTYIMFNLLYMLNSLQILFILRYLI